MDMQRRILPLIITLSRRRDFLAAVNNRCALRALSSTDGQMAGQLQKKRKTIMMRSLTLD